MPPRCSCMGVHTRGGMRRFGRACVQRQVTLKLPFMIGACGSHTNLYVPFFNVTAQVNVPLAPTDVFLFRPGPLRWKLWMLDRSLMTILYLPAFRLVTFAVPFFNVIVKPGPSTPIRVGVAAEAEATTTSAAASSVTSASRVRNMPLL